MRRTQSSPRTSAHDTTPRTTATSVIVTGALLELVLIVCMAAGLLTAVAMFFARHS